MIPSTCKRLIEVDFPIAAVSEQSAREKSIRHGHPSTLHLWWARRPLAACRSVLLGLLLPDPCDRDCPTDFKTTARELLAKRYGTGSKSDEELRELLLKFIGEFANWDHAANALYLEIGRGLVKAAHPEETPVVVDPFSGGGSIPLEALRLGCEAFASDLNPVACLILKALLEDIPRYGNAEFKLADDKGKEIVVHGLADALRHVGKQIKAATERELAQFYPVDLICPPEMIGKPCRVISIEDNSVGTMFFHRMDEELQQVQVQPGGRYYYIQTKGTPSGAGVFASAMDAGMNLKTSDPKLEEKLTAMGVKRIPEARPIAYLWARTVRCEGIGCGAEIPLVRSFWLSKRRSGKAAFRYLIERPSGKSPVISLEIFVPKNENEVPPGTVLRANATCPCCHNVVPAGRVRKLLATQNGGADAEFDGLSNRIGGARLLGVVVNNENLASRQYRLPTKRDYQVVLAAQRGVSRLANDLVPNEPIPTTELRRVAVPLYGLKTWGDMFTARQKLAMVTLTKLINALATESAESKAVKRFAGLALSRFSDICNAFCRWENTKTQVRDLFGRQAVPMLWDFAEPDLFGNNAGNYCTTLETMTRVIERVGELGWPTIGRVETADAAASPLPNQSASVWFTDPPYYDSVPYAHLSDFFYVWLKRAASADTGKWFEPTLTNKDAECVVDRPHSLSKSTKTPAYYESKMADAMLEGRRVLHQGGVGCVVFAHKTTEGWEALLSGILRSGFVITASWPITTEMANRMVAQDTAALAGSVHLVCRPRPADAGVGDWSAVKAAMEKRIREWLPTLVKHGVRGADAIFSCLGPALESYSRYEKVLTAADREVPLGGDPDAIEPEQRGFLAYVFETLSKEALRQVLGAPSGGPSSGEASAEGFEEDSRMTALFLWTLQATKASANGNGKAKPEVGEEDEGDDEDESKPKKAKAGFSMPFDTFIRITRPMGIHYPTLEHRVIEIEKGIVRLLPVRERSEQLLGEAATRPGIEITLEDVKQMELGLATQRREESDLMSKPKRGRRAADHPAPGKPTAEAEFTTLDRLHRAMLLFGLGRSTLLRQVLETELRQSKRFERLALALNALYPDGSDERRMLEGVQAAMRGIK